jgi:hypothetical protein
VNGRWSFQINGDEGEKCGVMLLGLILALGLFSASLFLGQAAAQYRTEFLVTREQLLSQGRYLRPSRALLPLGDCFGRSAFTL